LFSIKAIDQIAGGWMYHTPLELKISTKGTIWFPVPMKNTSWQPTMKCRIDGGKLIKNWSDFK
jgi:hypothetical protein